MIFTFAALIQKICDEYSSLSSCLILFLKENEKLVYEGKRKVIFLCMNFSFFINA